MSKVVQVRELQLNDSNRFNHFIIIIYSLIIDKGKKANNYNKSKICKNMLFVVIPKKVKR